jgi:hypothetical protein
MSQHAKQLDKRRKLDKTEKKKSHGSECPVRVKFQTLDPHDLHAGRSTLVEALPHCMQCFFASLNQLVLAFGCTPVIAMR